MTTSPSRKSDKRKKKLAPEQLRVPTAAQEPLSTPIHYDSNQDMQKIVYKRPPYEEDSVTVYGGNSWYIDYTNLYPNYETRQNKLFMTEQKVSHQLDRLPIVIEPPKEDYYPCVTKI